jgi:hypothetical protein
MAFRSRDKVSMHRHLREAHESAEVAGTPWLSALA